MRVKFPYPVLSQYLHLLELFIAFLQQKKHEHITVKIDDRVLDGVYEVRYFQQFVDDVDVFHYGPFSTELMNCLSEHPADLSLQASRRAVQQSLHELAHIQVT